MAASKVPSLVVVHPLVLLSVVDHYNRVAKDTDRRVVGILLGSVSKGRVEVTNSYAGDRATNVVSTERASCPASVLTIVLVVPFEEDSKNPKIWFLDHDYHENMWAMFRKVNAAERVIGWYSSGPKIKPDDLDIHELIRKQGSANPVFVIIDVNPSLSEVPTKAYFSVEEVGEDNQTVNRFHHVPAIIGALEAEEVGVEHLLRDVKDTNISTLATQINDKILSLKGLISRLVEMKEYIDKVIAKQLPLNHTIIRQMQEIFNLIPNLTNPDLLKAFMVKTNDMMLVIYVASLIRSVTALHDLINNKLDLASYESGEKKDKEANGEKKDGEKKDAKDSKDKKEEPAAKSDKDKKK